METTWDNPAEAPAPSRAAAEERERAAAPARAGAAAAAPKEDETFSFALDSEHYKRKFTTNWTTYGHPLKLMNPTEPVRVQQMTKPAETVAFADAAQINRFQAPATPTRPLFEQWYYVARAEATMHYVHDATANASMYDGHVRPLAPTSDLIDLFPEAPVGRPPKTIRLQVH